MDAYKPLFWMCNDDMRLYRETFGIVNSDCYARWGFERTGCTGCPYNKRAFEDLSMAEKFEPKTVMAARKVFADAYEYTRMYHEYVAARKDEGNGMSKLF